MPAKTKYKTRIKILKLGFRQIPQIEIAKKCNVGRLTVCRLLKKNNIQYNRNHNYLFWSKIKILGYDDCWEWQAFKDQDGYGKYSCWKDGNEQRVHRIMWILKFGSIPNGMLVCHKCDNPKCVNPNHLFLGTHYDNIKDKIDKNRQLRGGLHGRSKLTEKDVVEIRNQYIGGWGQITKLAKKYKVGYSTMYCIIHNKTWKHVHNTLQEK